MRRWVFLLGLLGAGILRGEESVRVVGTPTPYLGEPGRFFLDHLTTAGPHETVAEWHGGIVIGRAARVEVKYLGSNLLVGNFGDRVRYQSNEVELEVKAPLVSPGDPAGFSLAAAGFASRYWLDARDGAGARRSLTRDFFGPKLIAGFGRVCRPNLALTVLRAVEPGGRSDTVVVLGLGAALRVGASWELAAEGNPFLSNPLHYRRAWGAGARWHGSPRLTLGAYVTNTFGGLTPDSVFGSGFPQYRFQWGYVF